MDIDKIIYFLKDFRKRTSADSAEAIDCAVLLCPSCENEIAMIYNSVWQKGKYKQKYCDNCGQSLDWSDLKE